MAEALEISKALIFTKEIGIPRVILEIDSKVVVDRLLSPRLDDSYLNILIEDCLKLRCNFEVISFIYVRGFANSVAHEPAKLVQNFEFSFPTQEEIHPSILLFVLKDIQV